ncbi:MAG: glycosylasparaginase, partial [Croceitalea sp.]|nr:glycosylasparaginase [Croceitalea sp.]
MQRRKFLQKSSLSTAAVLSSSILSACKNEKAKAAAPLATNTIKPIVIATWNVPNATAKAWQVLENGGNALDAVEAGVKVEEADVDNQSV